MAKKSPKKKASKATEPQPQPESPSRPPLVGQLEAAYGGHYDTHQRARAEFNKDATFKLKVNGVFVGLTRRSILREQYPDGCRVQLVYGQYKTTEVEVS